MKLTVIRDKNNGDTSIGRLLIDYKFECFTLEDEPREKKVHGETRIPSGTYEIKLRTTGRFHEKYLQRFPEIHHGMLHVTNVPGFEYILIHTGNTDKDTAGCLLVGSAVSKSGWTLVDSTKAYLKMYPKVSAALLANEQVFINYINKDKKEI